jgi:hypothetical protein
LSLLFAARPGSKRSLRNAPNLIRITNKSQPREFAFQMRIAPLERSRAMRNLHGFASFCPASERAPEADSYCISNT